MLAVGIVVLNIAVALGIYFIANGRLELPMTIGILYGAVTNTPGLGAAQEALNQLNYTGDPIALGYACAYPLGVDVYKRQSADTSAVRLKPMTHCHGPSSRSTPVSYTHLRSRISLLAAIPLAIRRLPSLTVRRTVEIYS